jgi:16S rRNA processing protein RimM
VYLDRCPLSPAQLLAMGALEWRGPNGSTRPLMPNHVRAAAERLLVTFEGLHTREAAAPFVSGTLWAERARLPDPGPGVSYAFQLAGMRVVDQAGRTLGTVADVIFNAGQPLLQLEGEAGRLLPCQPPFMRHVDADAGVITLELPPGFDEL